MAGFRLTTKIQVSGWRFLLRRVEHAIVRRDTRMFDDPLQFYSRSVAAGLAAAILVMMGAAALAYFKPLGRRGGQDLLVDRSTNQLYVIIPGSTLLHPAYNLTSARLALGKEGMPVAVKSTELAKFPKPVVVAVNGVCAGGGVGLALAGDIVFAARSAYFVQVFGPKLGLVPDVGVTWYTPRLVGRARARALALLGDRLPAEKAAEWGLIWEAVDDDKLLETARATAARLAKGPRAGFAKIKEVLDASLDNTLEQQLDLERVTQGELGDDPDFREGVLAFLQKRDPVFR